MKQIVAGFEDFKSEWDNPKYRNQFHELSIVSENCEVAGSSMGSYSRLKKYVEFKNSTLGDYSYVSSFSVVNATDIGKFSSIAHGSFIGLWEHNMWVTTHSFYLYEGSGEFVKGYASYEKDAIRTSIGNDVWVGGNAMIRKGVKIADGAIVGAGSVVTKDVPPYAIVIGNPAKLYKYRFSPEDIDFLMETQWWNYSREDIQYLVDMKAWKDVSTFRGLVNERNGCVRPKQSES